MGKAIVRVSEIWQDQDDIDRICAALPWEFIGSSIVEHWLAEIVLLKFSSPELPECAEGGVLHEVRPVFKDGDDGALTLVSWSDLGPAVVP